ncbi:MAG TPA: FAD-dependent oxidoreductase [Burkholderiales bacterium]|nr:FAD-dependent oxidoreductase [Burkholderiales bacterium]
MTGPRATRIVLLGGGHAHAFVLLKFRDFVSKNLETVLVSPGPSHTYSGMVPGVIAGHYAPAQAQIDLASLARRAGAGFVQAQAVAIDAADKQVVLADGSSARYDVLSLDVGSVPAETAPDSVAVKPFDPFLARWHDLLQAHDAPRIAVVGAGAGGVEIAMAMKYALDRRAAGGTVELYSDRFAFAPALAARIRGALDRLAIPLRIGAAPAGAFDATFRVTGATALPLLGDSGLRTDAHGFVLVDASLRSVSHPDVFAAGDCASLEGLALPKSGVYAVRQAPVLAENLKRVVRGMAMLDFTPQRESLALISCGARYAIASRSAWSAEGRWAWRWKDWLDRRWIGRFS